MKNSFDQELAKLGFIEKVNSFVNVALPEHCWIREYKRSGNPNLDLLIWQELKGIGLTIETIPTKKFLYLTVPAILWEKHVIPIIQEYLGKYHVR